MRRLRKNPYKVKKSIYIDAMSKLSDLDDQIINMRNMADRTIFRIYLCDTLENIKNIINNYLNFWRIPQEMFNQLQITKRQTTISYFIPIIKKMRGLLSTSGIGATERIRISGHIRHLDEILRRFAKIYYCDQIMKIKAHISKYIGQAHIGYTLEYIVKIQTPYNFGFQHINNHIVSTLTDLDLFKKTLPNVEF